MYLSPQAGWGNTHGTQIILGSHNAVRKMQTTYVLILKGEQPHLEQPMTKVVGKVLPMME